jgi:hypothetical protein
MTHRLLAVLAAAATLLAAPSALARHTNVDAFVGYDTDARNVVATPAGCFAVLDSQNLSNAPVRARGCGEADPKAGASLGGRPYAEGDTWFHTPAKASLAFHAAADAQGANLGRHAVAVCAQDRCETHAGVLA